MTAVEGLRTLSLWQPYASLVACGAKTWETRGQRTHHRGRIGIASTASTPAAVRRSLRDSSAPRGGGRYLFREHLGDYSLEGESRGIVRALPQGVLMATAELADCCPIGGPMSFRTGSVEGDEGDHPGQAVVVHHPASGLGSGAGLDRPYLCVDDPNGPPYHLDITDQLPFGIWEPGRWAWRLADIKPTTERCPWCWGERGDPEDEGWRHQGVLEPGSRGPCPVCDGAGACAPVPVKGKQGLWTWRPEVAA